MPGPGVAAATPMDNVTVSATDLPMTTGWWRTACSTRAATFSPSVIRSEEHTSELQSHHDLVCRLLLEKKHLLNRPGRTATHPATRPSTHVLALLPSLTRPRIYP